MKLIGNIIWFIFGGWILGLLWSLLGLILCISIIGIPFGTQCFKAAKLSFAPYGKKVKLHPQKHLIMNVIWAILVGWELFVIYLVAGIVCCATIVGISNSMFAFKMMKLALCPFGAKVK